MDTYDAQISAGLAEMGLEPRVAWVGLLSAHVRAVFDANRTLNLTSVDPGDAASIHVLDSASAIPFLSSSPEGPFVDLGSGAGFPGIPLAVLSGRHAALVESVGKKARFLEGVVADCCLEATVHAVRAEVLAQQARGTYAAVTARALAALPSLVELAAPLLSGGGQLICLKGRPEREELARGDRAALICGMVRTETALVAVPGLSAVRTVVTYRRDGVPCVDLPRRDGMAQRNPLA